MIHLDTDKKGRHDRDISWKILGYNDPILSYLSMDNGKSGYFKCI